MIIIGDEKKRNLQEQVQKNKDDIEDLKSSTTSPAFANITGAPSDNTALNTALEGKVDKVTGKALSANDYTNADKAKLDAIDMDSKQDVLTSAQLAAVNSGVTSADVTAIASLITQMAAKSPLLEAGTNITLTTLASGKIQISSSGGGGGTWGSITGSLSNQADLWAELNAKLNATALNAYRTKADQDTIDTALTNTISNENTRALAAEAALQTSIASCLHASNIQEGTNIDVTVSGNNVIISCSLEAMEFKGSVATYADLPSSARNGDTYVVQDTFKVYTKTTSGWVQSGAAFDVSLFYTKTESDNRYLQLSGGTMIGTLTAPVLKAQSYLHTSDNNYSLSITAAWLELAPKDLSAIYYISYPLKTGTIALLSDLNNYYSKTEADAKYVDLTSTQTITGLKKFKGNTGAIQFLDDSDVIKSTLGKDTLTFRNGLTGSDYRAFQLGLASITYNYGTIDHTLIFPANSGTFALVGESYTKLECDTTFATLRDLNTYMPLSGGTFTGAVTFSTKPTITGYLETAGGTMTGSLTINNGDASILNSNNTSYVTYCGGTSAANGSILKLYGKEYAYESNVGGFELIAVDPGTGNTKSLSGVYNGNLSWGSENIAFASDLADYLPLSGGTMTGAITTQIKNAFVRNNNTEWICICGGTSPSDGASITLRGQNSADGQIQLRAASATSNRDWYLNADGSMSIATTYSMAANGTFTKKSSGDLVICDADSYAIGIKAATSYTKGAHLDLYGGTNAGAGIFALSAAKEGTVVDLAGKPDGTLKWNNKDVATNKWNDLTVVASSGCSWNTTYSTFKYNENMIIISFVDATCTAVPASNLFLTFTIPTGYSLLKNQTRSVWSTMDGSSTGLMFNSGSQLAVTGLSAGTTFSGEIIIPITR